MAGYYDFAFVIQISRIAATHTLSVSPTYRSRCEVRSERPRRRAYVLSMQGIALRYS